MTADTCQTLRVFTTQSGVERIAGIDQFQVVDYAVHRGRGSAALLMYRSNRYRQVRPPMAPAVTGRHN